MKVILQVINWDRKVIKKTDNDPLKKVTAVFQSNKINSFIDLHNKMINKGPTYLFLISNVERKDKTGTFWCNILNLHPKYVIYCIIILLS